VDEVRQGQARVDIRGLWVRFGAVAAVRGIDLTADAGRATALLGRNGAGKSTTLKAVMGLVEVTGGEILFEGHRLDGRPTHEISRLGVGFVPEDRRIFADLTVAENLMVGARDGAGGWTTERVFQLFPALRRLAGQRGGSLSGGEQQMLTIARTLMTSPRLLLLDEPSEGLAPVVVRLLADAIAALRRADLTIVLSEQNLKFARRLADRAYIIEKGQIKFEGPITALDADEALRRAYLSV
jgi:branched-chain amino acid transport system ATP-binding protein